MVSDYITVHIWQNYRQSYAFVGTLVLDHNQNNGAVSFQYDYEYVKKGGAALDPKNLPTSLPKLLYADSKGNGDLPLYFRQFIPGAYAQVLLQKTDPQWYRLNEFSKLKTMTNCFGDHGAILLDPHLNQINKPISSESDMHRIAEFLVSLKSSDLTSLDDSKLLALLSLTGNKPKFDYVDGTKGKRYVGKIDVSSFFDEPKMRIVIEKLADIAGIESLNIKNERLPNGQSISLQQNFKHDFIEHDGAPMLLKYNTVSFDVLRKSDISGRSQNGFSLEDAADIIERYSVEPLIDKEQLLLRAVFSASFNHTTNGVNDLALIDYERDKWRLAPACNVLPNPAEEQSFALQFDQHLTSRLHFSVNSEFSIHIGKLIGLDETIALRCFDAVKHAISEISTICSQVGLSKSDSILLNKILKHGIENDFVANNNGPALG